MAERKTENLVRDKLRSYGYYTHGNGITIEEQKSEIVKVKELLSKASKNQKGNSGLPEFIISNLKDPNFLIIFECKADVKKHESANRDNAVDFAVDGALHYAKHLAKQYTVLAIAVSGTTASSLKISNYIHPAGAECPKALVNEAGVLVEDILPFEDYYRLASFDPDVAKKRHSDLLAFSRELHELIWTKAKISEEDKPLLVSGTLIALMNTGFMRTFESIPAEDLQGAWLGAIKKELDKADIPQAKKDTMLQPYSTIAVHPNLSKPDSKLAREYPDGVFKAIITEINSNVWPYISIYHDFDVVGQFYGEFLKYTAGDKKALGIVLTPRHIAELFSLLSNVCPQDKVLDICAGTGGFLISAMQHMLKVAATDEERIDIKKNRLIGIENNPKMFALAASNMILRGDGKANLHQGSCFDDAIIKAIKEMEPNVGLLNPPYAQSKSDAELHELYFVKQMLDCLKPGGTGIAIVPMSCAISPNDSRNELMKYHTLEAVMSMPADLFYPVGTVTCIMVWTVGKPHAQSNKKTWFGYWKNDGFIKTKNLGRIDQNGAWPAIRDRWVEMFRNREVHAGESVTKQVGVDDEWCAEAYMETDYSNVFKSDFDSVVRNYAAFQLLGAPSTSSSNEDTTSWKDFRYDDIFAIERGESFYLKDLKEGKFPYVSASAQNNGVTAYVSIKNQEGNAISLAYDGSIGEAFYQPEPFLASEKIAVLRLNKKWGKELNRSIAFFLIALIRKEKFRYNYGLKWSVNSRLLSSIIKLPVTESGKPNWDFMEGYINDLPFGIQF